LILTLLGTLAFLGCFLKIYYVFSSEIRAVRPWYPGYISLSTILLMVALFGLMQMKRWGFFLFTVFFLIHQGVQVTVGLWDIGSSLLFTAILLVGVLQFKKLSP
jgi:hypothetical protein